MVTVFVVGGLVLVVVVGVAAAACAAAEAGAPLLVSGRLLTSLSRSVWRELLKLEAAVFLAELMIDEGGSVFNRSDIITMKLPRTMLAAPKK